MKAVKSINTQSSNDHDNGKVVENPWSDLRRFTDARIGLGRAGISLPTAEMLAFQLSHAQARDAVNFPLDISEMTKTLSAIDALSEVEKPLSVQSEAVDRVTYLQRPDLGRKLNQAGRTTLLNTMQSRQSSTQAQYDLAIVVVDGLSSLAVQKNAAPFISELLSQLHSNSMP